MSLQRRNLGGARREASEKVELWALGLEDTERLEAWTLNLSRGGLRVVLEQALQVGAIYGLQPAEGEVRQVRVVWVREAPDGQIAGLEYLELKPASAPVSE